VTAIVTTQQAVEFWARKAAEYDTLLNELDTTLPATVRDQMDGSGRVPFADATREAVEEALGEARLAADTVLGAYTRVLHQERATPQANGYNPQVYQQHRTN
jgi:hypothetical protein